MLMIRVLLPVVLAFVFVFFMLRRWYRGLRRSLVRDPVVPDGVDVALPPIDPGVFERGRTVQIGQLEVPTGRLVVCDPIVFPDEPPLARTIPPGTYAVDVSLVDIRPQHTRVGAMRLLVSDRRATSFEHACAFGVDAGLAGIMDVRTQAERERRNAQLEEHSPNANYYDDILAQELEDPPREWTMHRPLPDGGNIAIAHSGWGDGVYSCFWQLDDSAQPVALIVDFHVRADDAMARLVDAGEDAHVLTGGRPPRSRG